MNGDIIGIDSFILSRSGQSSGVGFAIPAALVKRVVETALGGGHSLVRAWLGARTQSVSPEIAKTLGLATPQGALVADVWPGGPAAQAGLKQGDVIVAVDGRPTVDAASVNYAVSTHRIGDAVRISVRRGSATQQLTLRAEAPPASPARDERVITGRNPLQGATVVNFSPAVADEMGVDPFSNPGVVITQGGQGLAAQAGLKSGDIVRSINGRKVASVRDLVTALSAGSAVWQIVIERDGQEISGTFQV
jgi:S1-C subfamily serine protease